MGIQAKILCSDDTGENKMLQKALESEESNIDLQYTTAGKFISALPLIYLHVEISGGL